MYRQIGQAGLVHGLSGVVTLRDDVADPLQLRPDEHKQPVGVWPVEPRIGKLADAPERLDIGLISPCYSV